MIQVRKIAFWAEKAITFRFRKIAFSGRQDARNCVKVVLTPWKGFPFPIRKIAFSAKKSSLFLVRKTRFLNRKKRFLSDSKNSLFLIAKTLEIASRLFWRLEKASLSDSKNRLFSQKKLSFFQVRKNCFFRSPRRSKLRQGALKKLPLSGSEKSPF